MSIRSLNLFSTNVKHLNFKSGKSLNNQSVPMLNNCLACDTVSFGKKQTVEEKQKLFDDYNPKIKDFDRYKLPVHNNNVFYYMKDFYTKDDFKELFKYAEENGTFDLHINPKTKFVQTSLIDPKDNPLMSKLVWVTDSCNFMPILKDKYPEICVPLMENISKYYAKQQASFDRIIKNPDLFELNHDWPPTAKNGVGHVFNPENGISHKWFAKTRLDSMGLYLRTMSDLITEGMNGKDYGYKKASDVSKNTVESIANSVKYLQKINYAYAKDTGPWEERTFNATTTSDVAIINDAFRKILDLMYSPCDNKEILKLRKRLLAAKNGDVFKDEKALRTQLFAGEYRIRTNSESEVPNERVLDGAMSFIFKTETLDENVVKNAKKVFKRLAVLEKGAKNNEEIVRNHGVIRYSKDRYLYLNSDLSGDKPEYQPQRKFPKKSEAQWFMVSDIATSYGKIAQSLMDKIEKDGFATKEVDSLLRKALRKQTEYINRSYARLTGENTYKANAKSCPAFQVPEAYQAVSDSKGNVKFVPGTHTPLTWAQSSLYEASKLYEENLQRFENLFK